MKMNQKRFLSAAGVTKKCPPSKRIVKSGKGLLRQQS